MEWPSTFVASRPPEHHREAIEQADRFRHVAPAAGQLLQVSFQV